MELTNLLIECVERKASDLHLVPGLLPTLRINGALVPVEGGENGPSILGPEEVGDLFEPFLTEAQKLALHEKQDINTGLSAVEWRFRVCIFRDRCGLSASLRLIPTRIPTLQELFAPETEATFRGLINRKRGLILVAGNTGSGKSTTTAAMIDAINRERGERIFTIEDPIEYVLTSKLSLVSQREVGSDVESFEQGALSALRSDPDVILVGELRTPEAVRIALALAETGHLVFSTLQADSVSESVRRIVEAFPESRETMRRMFARSLNAIIAQRLVPRAARAGRVPVNEIMIVNSRIRHMIDEGETALSLAIEAGRDEGMRTMDDSALQLYRDGTITYETAWGIVQDRDRLGPKPPDAA